MNSYLRKSDYLPSMDIKLATLEDQDSGLDDTIPFGSFMEGLVPVAPQEGEFIYRTDETLHTLEPAFKTLQVPEIPGILPPLGRYFPTPPVGGYTLMKTQAYTRGFVYVANYDLGSMENHKHRLINISTPPLTSLNGNIVVPGMIRMEAGIPFAFRFDGDAQRMHTVGCLQTLESLKPYPDYPQIRDASVQLAKLSWGCSSDDGSPSIPPVYELEGLKPNDRSTTRPFQDDTHDGSYSLGHTVMKGDGLGTVLPSVQANSAQAVSQISAILKTLHTLRRLVMPKCLSRFENDIWDFHMDFNNVFSFGGLEPNGSSVQLNVSSLGVNLNQAIGMIQGFWHADFLDDPQFWTLFIMLLRIGPDLHTGTAPHEDAQSHAEWVRSVIDSVWNLAGPQNRLGYVIYLGRVPSKRSGSTNVTPPTGFGNYGSNAAHKATQKNFASDGHTTMGSQDDRANRLGREAVSNFYNTLRHCHLSLNIDINKLMEFISYDDHGVKVSLRPLPYHPVHDRQHIKQYLAFCSWHSSESDLFNLGITNKMLRLAAPTDLPPPLALLENTVEFVPEPDCVSLSVQEVLSRHVVAGRPVFTIRLVDDDQVYNIAQDHPCVLQNELVQAWVMQHLSLDSTHRPIQETLPSRMTRANARLLSLTTGAAAAASTSEPNNSIPTEDIDHNTALVNTAQTNPPALTVDAPKSTNSETRRPQRTNTRKRKYHTGSESDEDSTSSSSDDSDAAGESGPTMAHTNNHVYEVEKIVGHRYFDRRETREWLVKFKGYDSPEYVTENNLTGSLRLLSRYNSKHGLENLHLRKTIAKNVPRQDVVAPRVNAVSELAANLNQLLWLLSERRLDSEIAAMVQRFQNAINGGKNQWSTDVTISSLASLWNDHCNSTYELSNCLPFFESSPIDTAIIKFSLTQKSMAMLPKINASLHLLDIVERGLQRENDGFEVLEKKSPPLALLVDHVVQYVYSCVVDMRKTNLEEKPAQRPRLGKNHEIMVAFTNFPQSCFHQKIAPESLSHVPGNLYGLLESQKSRKSVKLPAVTKGRLPVATNPMLALVGASTACLEKLWSREIILPAVKSLESHSAFNTTCSRDDLDILLDRAVTRGAILSCIQEACQSDGIFASEVMKTFLSRPTQDIFPTDQRDARRIKKLQGSERDEYLEPLRDEIENHLNKYPAIVEKAACLGELMETHLFAVHTGGVVDYDNFLSLVGDDSPEDSDLASESLVRTKRTGRQFASSNWTIVPVAKNALLSQVLPTPFIAPLALILREALNKKRNLGPANETMSRILNGSHPNQSSTRVFPPNHTDPIRQFSEYATLFRKHLPGQWLTSRSGISSLLSWMGTGQGSGTKEFLSRIVRPNGFYSSTVNELLEAFQPIISNNRNLSFQLGSSTDGTKMHLITGYIPCFDERIWGQPNNLFNICPVIRSKGNTSFPLGQKPRLTIVEKFAPYWSSSTQDKWVKFLGPMVDQDPDVWVGEKPTWFAVMDFLQALEIPLFGRGLTVLQTANNLVYANIATMPTPAEVSGWIVKHKSLGAHRGLQILGFSYLSSYAGVKFAFTALYDHLDHFLSNSDKEILGFDPLFLEHVLCKVARWSSRLQSSKANGDVLSLHALSTHLADHLPVWASGENEQNHLAIPFPLTISKARLIAVRELLTLEYQHQNTLDMQSNQIDSILKPHLEDQYPANDELTEDLGFCFLQHADTSLGSQVKELPATIASYKEAQRLVQDAYLHQKQINNLYTHLRFAYLKAQHKLLALQPQRESADRYYLDVISMVGASGYEVALAGGKQPKITVSQKSGTISDSGGLQVQARNANVNTTTRNSNNQQQLNQHGNKPSENTRPKRSNRGQGGHLGQTLKYITTAAQKQHETSNKSSSGLNTTRDMPGNLLENPNAPPLKKPRKALKSGGEIQTGPTAKSAVSNTLVLAPKPRAHLAPTGSKFGFIPNSHHTPGNARPQEPTPAVRYLVVLLTIGPLKETNFFYKGSLTIKTKFFFNIPPVAGICFLLIPEDGHGTLPTGQDSAAAGPSVTLTPTGISRHQTQNVGADLDYPMAQDDPQSFHTDGPSGERESVQRKQSLRTRDENDGDYEDDEENEEPGNEEPAQRKRSSRTRDDNDGNYENDEEDEEPGNEEPAQRKRSSWTRDDNDGNYENDEEDEEVGSGDSGDENMIYDNDAAPEDGIDNAYDDNGYDGYEPPAAKEPEEPLQEEQDSQEPQGPIVDHRNIDVHDDDNSYGVLEQHHSFNRPHRAPMPAELARSAQRQEMYLRDGNDNGDLNGPDDDGEDASGLVDEEASRANDEEASGADDEEPGETDGQNHRRPRNTVNPQGAASHRNVSYYGPTYKRALERAKNDWRHYLATENPWPNRRDHIGKATTFLTRRIQESKDDGAFLKNRIQDRRMDSVIYNEASTFRGVIKSRAREVIKVHYANIIFPHLAKPQHRGEPGSESECEEPEMPENQEGLQTIIREGVRDILDNCRFHHIGQVDANGKTANFAHPALKALVHEVFYKPKDGLARLYPTSFNDTVPIVAVLLAATAISCALAEHLTYEFGQISPIDFTAATYESTYDALEGAYNKICSNAYHNRALHLRLREWARSGINMYVKPKKRANTVTVEVVLD
ncbi:hypothetical protein D9619_011737 [Psilocybe cf. subviscida]|uniref:Chromo domain-containing protein n=1 Tax=Psilocybe cf. subviscida TaxID=2480587 RepID=A0A8H5B0N9_9AGAR|nr:hypothetical protein D9619_011737 [Psilocybe cf. subviscida]